MYVRLDFFVIPFYRKLRTLSIKSRIEEMDQEIIRFLDAIGSGKLPLSRVEKAISEREEGIKKLQAEYDNLKLQITENLCSEYDTEKIKRCLQDFARVFDHLTPNEKSEAIRCLLKSIEVHSDKIVLQVYEREGIKQSSQNRSNWLPRKDSNLDKLIQSQIHRSCTQFYQILSSLITLDNAMSFVYNSFY